MCQICASYVAQGHGSGMIQTEPCSKGFGAPVIAATLPSLDVNIQPLYDWPNGRLADGPMMLTKRGMSQVKLHWFEFRKLHDFGYNYGDNPP